MVVLKSGENGWYQTTIGDTHYAIRLTPVGQHSTEVLMAKFHPRDDVDGEPVATVTVNTITGKPGDLRASSEEVLEHRAQFEEAARLAVQDWTSEHAPAPTP